MAVETAAAPSVEQPERRALLALSLAVVLAPISSLAFGALLAFIAADLGTSVPLLGQLAGLTLALGAAIGLLGAFGQKPDQMS